MSRTIACRDGFSKAAAHGGRCDVGQSAASARFASETSFRVAETRVQARHFVATGDRRRRQRRRDRFGHPLDAITIARVQVDLEPVRLSGARDVAIAELHAEKVPVRARRNVGDGVGPHSVRGR
jgi:hypothetical protein